ncbi:MAG: efflux RND transporter periplasmic adaptor subunit [Alphaproteobacteria bacterium]|nr:efflux RND transporter periplasmic adaptor subunit [Alphaproteobacteria bacterium]
MKKFLVFLLIVIIALGAFWFIKSKNGSERVVYDYDKAHYGNIEIEVTASGTIQPVNVVSVGTQVSGTIEHIYVDYNSVVEQGQLIAELDPFTLDESLKESEATLKETIAKLKQAKVDERRNAELYKSNYISKHEWEETQISLVSAEASYKRALAELNKAKKNRGYAQILSPVSGTVITKAVEEGQTVASSFNTPELFKIAEDLKKMQIEASVSEADIGSIKVGMPVEFTVDTYTSDIFFGRVSQIRLQPKEDSNVVMYTVIISISNDDLRLMPGMTAYVSIKVENKENVLRIKNLAFQYRPVVAGERSKNVSNAEKAKIKAERQSLKPNESFLYKEIDNKPFKIKVVKGIQNLVYTEILEGLKDGDKVIVEDLTTKVKTKRSH